MEEIVKSLQEIVDKKTILVDEPMKNHTSLRIGGTADIFINVRSVDDLKAIISLLKKKKVPFVIIGNGTNLLVRDGGIRGVVLKIDFKDFKIKRNANEALITADAGMPLGTLSSICLKEEFTGLEFLAGIPGTIGGAIRMNAGAYGKEMKDVVVKSRYITYDGKIKTLDLASHKFGYRSSVFEQLEGIVIDTTIKCSKGKKEDIEATIKELMAKRVASQPLDYANAGSTFKRHGDLLTAKLIDECGLKGYNVGDAEVSLKHAGFLINKGKATAKDFLKLIDHVKKVVKEKHGVDIELEILVIGEE